MQITPLEMVALHMINTGFASRIHKELQQINKKQPTNQRKDDREKNTDSTS